MKRVARTRAQAADVPLDEAGAEADDEEEVDDEDEDDDETLAFVSEPDDDVDDAESDDFAVDDAGVLLDDELRLSFR